jgi:pentatricopeptide repeat protein
MTSAASAVLSTIASSSSRSLENWSRTFTGSSDGRMESRVSRRVNSNALASSSSSSASSSSRRYDDDNKTRLRRRSFVATAATNTTQQQQGKQIQTNDLFSKTSTPAEICQTVLDELKRNPNQPGLRVTVFTAIQALAIDRDCVLHCCALLRECLEKYGDEDPSIVSPATIALLVRVERARTKALGFRNRSSSRMRYVAAVFKLAEEKYAKMNNKGGKNKKNNFLFCSAESYCDMIQILAKYCSDDEDKQQKQKQPTSALMVNDSNTKRVSSSTTNKLKLVDPKCPSLGARVEPTLDSALDFWQRLETLLEEKTKAKTNKVNNNSKPLFPSDLDNNAIVTGVCALVSAKKRSEAERFLSKTNPKLLSASCFNVLIESFGDEKNARGVQSTLKMMRGFNVPENEATFGALVTAFAKCDQLEQAEEFLELAGKKKYATARSKPGVRAYTSYIQNLCRSKRVDEARKILFEEMLGNKIEVKPNVHTFTAFINGLNYSDMKNPGSLSEEKKIVEEMFQTLETMQNSSVQPTTATFNAILKRVSVLFSSNSSAKTKKIDEYARSIIDDVFREMESVNCLPNLITFNTLIDAAVASDRPNDAYEWLSRLAASGLKPDQYTYATLLKFFALRRDANGTKWVLGEIDRLRVRVDVRVYNAAFNALSKSGEIDETVQLIEKLESTTGVAPDAASYLVIIDAYAADSKIKEAFKVYETFCRGEGQTDARTRSRMVRILCDFKKSSSSSSFQEASVWIESIIEKDSVSEDERIQLRQAMEKYSSASSPLTKKSQQIQQQQVQQRRVIIREAILLPNEDADVSSSREFEGMYAMYSMEKDNDSNEIKLTKTNVPCDTDQSFEWNRGVQMWKFWLGLPNSYYRDNDSPFTDEDEENNPKNMRGPLKV